VGGKALRLLDLVESSVLTRGQRLGLASWINCDQLLASIVVDRSVVTSSFRTHATVELAGTHTRGQLVMDHLNTRQPNLTIVKAVDHHKHLQRLLQLKHL
jgi:inosine-uridine nucleoside N-ribohydrolase